MQKHQLLFLKIIVLNISLCKVILFLIFFILFLKPENPRVPRNLCIFLFNIFFFILIDNTDTKHFLKKLKN
jgi:hypothetical protein